MKPTAGRLSPARMKAPRAAATTLQISQPAAAAAMESKSVRVAAARPAASQRSKLPAAAAESQPKSVPVESTDAAVGSTEAFLTMVDAAVSNSAFEKKPKQDGNTNTTAEETLLAVASRHRSVCQEDAESCGTENDARNREVPPVRSRRRRTMNHERKRKSSISRGAASTIRGIELPSAPRGKLVRTSSKKHCKFKELRQPFLRAHHVQSKHRKFLLETKNDTAQFSEFSRMATGMNHAYEGMDESVRRSTGLLLAARKPIIQGKAHVSNRALPTDTQPREQLTQSEDNTCVLERRTSLVDSKFDREHKTTFRFENVGPKMSGFEECSGKPRPCRSLKSRTSSKRLFSSKISIAAKPLSRTKSTKSFQNESDHRNLQLKNKEETCAGKTLLEEPKKDWAGLTYCNGKPFIPGAFYRTPGRSAELEKATLKPKKKSDIDMAGIRRSPKLTRSCEYAPTFRTGTSKTQTKTTKSNLDNVPAEKELTSANPSYCEGKRTVAKKSHLVSNNTDSVKSLSKLKKRSRPMQGNKHVLELVPPYQHIGKSFQPGGLDSNAVHSTFNTNEPKVKSMRDPLRKHKNPEERHKMTARKSKEVTAAELHVGPAPLRNTVCKSFTGEQFVYATSDDHTAEKPPGQIVNPTNNNKGKKPKVETHVVHSDGKLAVGGFDHPDSVPSKANLNENNESKENQCKKEPSEGKQGCNNLLDRYAGSRERSTNTLPRGNHAQADTKTAVSATGTQSAHDKEGITRFKSGDSSRETIKTVKSSGEPRLKSLKKNTSMKQNNSNSAKELRGSVGSPHSSYRRKSKMSTVGRQRDGLPHRRPNDGTEKSKENCRPREPMPKSLKQSDRVQRENKRATAAKTKCESIKQKSLQRTLARNTAYSEASGRTGVKHTGSGRQPTKGSDNNGGTSSSSVKKTTFAKVECRKIDSETRQNQRVSMLLHAKTLTPNRRRKPHRRCKKGNLIKSTASSLSKKMSVLTIASVAKLNGATEVENTAARQRESKCRKVPRKTNHPTKLETGGKDDRLKSKVLSTSKTNFRKTSRQKSSKRFRPKNRKKHATPK